MSDKVHGTWYSYAPIAFQCEGCHRDSTWKLVSAYTSYWCDECRKTVAEPQLVDGGRYD